MRANTLGMEHSSKRTRSVPMRSPSTLGGKVRCVCSCSIVRMLTPDWEWAPRKFKPLSHGQKGVGTVSLPPSSTPKPKASQRRQRASCPSSSKQSPQMKWMWQRAVRHQPAPMPRRRHGSPLQFLLRTATEIAIRHAVYQRKGEPVSWDDTDVEEYGKIYIITDKDSILANR